MDKYTFFIAAGVAILVIFVGLYIGGSILLATPSDPGDVSDGNGVFNIPIIWPGQGRSTKPPPGTGAPTGHSTTTILTFSRTPLETRKFTGDADVVFISDRTGEEYMSLGTLPFEWNRTIATTSVTKTAIARGYELLYFPETGTFSVLLLKEPLSEVRRAATEDLGDRLGISGAQLCDVVVDVQVAVDNPLYRAKHIGLPGCKDAVVLPGD